MLHQTLVSTSFPFHLSSSSSSSSSRLLLAPSPNSHSSQVEMEMLCSGNQQQHGGSHTDEGNLLAEEFVVEDLLDLDDGGLTDTEKEPEEQEGKENVVMVGSNKEEEEEDENNSNSSSLSSTVSYLSPLSELALPAHDVAELEWVSRLMDDSLSEFPPVPPVKPPAQDFPATAAADAIKDKGKRSKRSRPSASWYNWSGIPDSSSSSSSSTTMTTTTTTTTSSVSSSSSYSSPLIFFPSPLLAPSKKQSIPKKRGRKPKLPVPPSALGEAFYSSAAEAGGTERRCSHCGVSKTPQWRAGPMGAKTLCNACGVRFKSGRLLPEYRPACSPTFVSHVHSNSHRKVLEMRRKKEVVSAEDDNNPKNQSFILVCSAPAVASF